MIGTYTATGCDSGTTISGITCPCCGSQLVIYTNVPSRKEQKSLEQIKRELAVVEKWEAAKLAAKMRLIQSVLGDEYICPYFLKNVPQTLFTRRMMVSKSGFIGRAGKRLRRGK